MLKPNELILRVKEINKIISCLKKSANQKYPRLNEWTLEITLWQDKDVLITLFSTIKPKQRVQFIWKKSDCVFKVKNGKRNNKQNN